MKRAHRNRLGGAQLILVWQTMPWRSGRCLLRTLLLWVIAVLAIGVIVYSVGIIGDKVDKDTWNELLPSQLQFDTKKPARPGAPFQASPPSWPTKPTAP
jgi:hypothetical protein